MNLPRIGSIIAIFFASFTFANAGDKVGGGGAAVVCGKSGGKAASVKLLDLYQAELEGKLTIVRSALSKEVQIRKALQHIQKYLAFDVTEAIQRIKIDYLAPNIRLNQPYDLGSTAVQIEDGCTLEWVAYYDTTDRLQIVTKYFNQMSMTDKAALFVHEGIYKLAREKSDETNSERSRRIVGLIFSAVPNAYEIRAITAPLWNRGCEVDAECSRAFRAIEVVGFPNVTLTFTAYKLDPLTEMTIRVICYGSNGEQIGYREGRSPGGSNSEYSISMTGLCRYAKFKVFKDEDPDFNAGWLKSFVFEFNGASVESDVWSTYKVYPKIH